MANRAGGVLSANAKLGAIAIIASVPAVTMIRKKWNGKARQAMACNQARSAADSKAGQTRGASSPAGRSTAPTHAIQVRATAALPWTIGHSTRVKVLTGSVNVRVGKPLSRASSGASALIPEKA